MPSIVSSTSAGMCSRALTSSILQIALCLPPLHCPHASEDTTQKRQHTRDPASRNCTGHKFIGHNYVPEIEPAELLQPYRVGWTHDIALRLIVPLVFDHSQTPRDPNRQAVPMHSVPTAITRRGEGEQASSRALQWRSSQQRQAWRCGCARAQVPTEHRSTSHSLLRCKTTACDAPFQKKTTGP